MIQQNRYIMFLVDWLAHSAILPASFYPWLPHPFPGFPSQGRGNFPAFILAESGDVFSGLFR